MLTFQDGRGLQDLLLDPGVLPADGCQELQDQLGALGLPSSRFTAATHRKQFLFPPQTIDDLSSDKV